MKINHKNMNICTLCQRICFVFCGVVVAMCFYVFTVGLVAALIRHTGDSGRLQWLPSTLGAMAALEVYELPARLLAREPLADKMFEASASFWWAVTDPPDATP
jgi:hypothetical protein